MKVMDVEFKDLKDFKKNGLDLRIETGIVDIQTVSSREYGDWSTSTKLAAFVVK